MHNQEWFLLFKADVVVVVEGTCLTDDNGVLDDVWYAPFDRRVAILTLGCWIKCTIPYRHRDERKQNCKIGFTSEVFDGGVLSPYIFGWKRNWSIVFSAWAYFSNNSS